MTTLKDYKEKVLEETQEDCVFCGGLGHSDPPNKFPNGKEFTEQCSVCDGAGVYFKLKDVSLAIDNAVAEAFKAVEVEKANVKLESEVGSEYSTPGIIRGNGWNLALTEVEDRKKQYLV